MDATAQRFTGTSNTEAAPVGLPPLPLAGVGEPATEVVDPSDQDAIPGLPADASTGPMESLVTPAMSAEL